MRDGVRRPALTAYGQESDWHMAGWRLEHEGLGDSQGHLVPVPESGNRDGIPNRVRQAENTIQGIHLRTLEGIGAGGRPSWGLSVIPGPLLVVVVMADI